MSSLTPTPEESDGRFFSERAKNIFLSSGSPRVEQVKSSTPDPHFSFSNRSYGHRVDTPVGPATPSPSAGRDRTAVPLSSFVLQRDTELSSTTNSTFSSPVLVKHDEEQCARPYLAPPSHGDGQVLSSRAYQRNLLLSVLKEIEYGLKTL